MQYIFIYIFFNQHVLATSLGSKRKQVVELLSRKGAQINEPNKELLTPLHIAADYGHFDVMEAFIRVGARVNATDGLGQTG